jgi:predicted O-methyltransferase YrrM
MAPCWREDYVNIKYGIAKTLQPRRICEIGVYSGIAAMCFLHACPTATYEGFDNLASEKSRGITVVANTQHILSTLRYRATISIMDTQTMDSLPGEYDFIHVDGDHSRAGAKHDVTIAWKALTPNGAILVDNGHDTGVAAGTFEAMFDLIYGRLLDWRYLSGSAGNILIFKEPLNMKGGKPWQ